MLRLLGTTVLESSIVLSQFRLPRFTEQTSAGLIVHSVWPASQMSHVLVFLIFEELFLHMPLAVHAGGSHLCKFSSCIAQFVLHAAIKLSCHYKLLLRYAFVFPHAPVWF